MLFVENLFKVLKKNKVNFFSGVPDSILKNFSLYLEKKKLKNIVAANEGSAVSIGIGSFLEKKKISCVYLQNSGLGNAVNPLASIAHKDVYSIPKDLIKHARIKKDIVLSAAVNILEIWDKSLYEEVIDEAKVDFSSLAEEVMGDENEWIFLP